MDRQQNPNWFMSMGGNVAATLCATVVAYLEGFMPRQSNSEDSDAGLQWMQSILDGPEDICMNFFRMEALVLLSLCEDLKNNYGLRDTNISALEKVGIFLFVIASHRTNRDAQAIFRHSGWTISYVFHEVLECIVGRSRNFSGLVKDFVRPLDPTFSVSTTLMNDRRYYPYFQNCIGAIDGTHISACVPQSESGKYRNRKGWCSFNVMATCDFDLHFTFVAVGYEGSAHDSKVLNEVLNNHKQLFPVAPEGKFYVADKGYPDRLGFLTPYPDGRYHLTEFENVGPRDVHELFNKRHSSLRSSIERSFGCLKQKWRILHEMPPFPLETQIDIIMACFALNNYIRLHKRNDAHFNQAVRFPRQMLAEVRHREQRQPHDEQVPLEDMAPMEQRVVMSGVRNQIAASILGDVSRR